MSTKIRNQDVPMNSDSAVLRARLQRVETDASEANPHGENSETWGDYEADVIFDNENWDDPARGLSLAQLAALEPKYRVIRYQNQDPEKAELLELIQSPMFQAVEYLDLRRNFRSPSDAEWAELIETGALAHLRFLGLDSCYSVADATLQAIGSGAMPKLEALEIGSTEVTDEGLQALADPAKTPALQVVQGMFMGELSEEGIEALAAARPGLTIRFTD